MKKLTLFLLLTFALRGMAQNTVAIRAGAVVDRYHLCFALGKAFEDQKQYSESWQYYERGSKLKRAECHYRSEITERDTRKQIEVCTAEFFSRRADASATVERKSSRKALSIRRRTTERTVTTESAFLCG